MDIFNKVCVFLVLVVIPVYSLYLPNHFDAEKMYDIQKIARNALHKYPLKSNLGGAVIEATKLQTASKIGSVFKWNKCRNSTLLDLKDLTLSPDPLHFPGNIYVSFSGIVKETVDAPLQVNITLKKQLGPNFWLKVPCIEGIGSCSYDDLCDILSGATCPNPLVKYNIPCKCPFPKGQYKMQKSGFNINLQATIPNGDYYIKSDISFNNKPVLCVEIYFAIEA